MTAGRPRGAGRITIFPPGIPTSGTATIWRPPPPRQHHGSPTATSSGHVEGGLEVEGGSCPLRPTSRRTRCAASWGTERPSDAGPPGADADRGGQAQRVPGGRGVAGSNVRGRAGNAPRRSRRQRRRLRPAGAALGVGSRWSSRHLGRPWRVGNRRRIGQQGSSSAPLRGTSSRRHPRLRPRGDGRRSCAAADLVKGQDGRVSRRGGPRTVP